jgi:Rod binding domain-containing protein
MNSISNVNLPPPSLAASPMDRPDARATPEDAGMKFEGMFASMLIKQMRQSLNHPGLFGNDPSDVLGGLFDHFMGQYIGQQGRLGIGAMMQKQIEKRSDPT